MDRPADRLHQAPVDRADRLASTDPTGFFSVPEKLMISKVSGEASAQPDPLHPVETLVHPRIDSFMSYMSGTPFQLRLNLELKKPGVVVEGTLYPRAGFEQLVPRYISISAAWTAGRGCRLRRRLSMVSVQRKLVPCFRSSHTFKFVRLVMNSLEYSKTQVQISEVILD